MLFHYTSIGNDGVKIEADVESGSLDQAIALLQKRGLAIVNIVEKKESKGLDAITNFHFLKPKVKPKDLVIFSRQIATLFQAGVPALKGFRLLAQENENIALQKELTSVADDIEAGVSLSESLSRRPGIFSPFYINMVKAGEESGKLNERFLYLADYLDRDYELTQKIKKALTYPSFVIGTFVVIMVGMLTFVIPKMAALFADQGADLPLVTKIILGISDVFVKYWAISFPIIVIAIWIFYKWSKTERGTRKIDEIKTRIPVIKTLYQRIFLTRLADNMNTMLTSGVPIVRSIDITSAVVENVIYKDLLKRVSQKVQTGVAFSKALYEEPLAPNILVQMVHIGEETGELAYILNNLAIFYKRELDTSIDRVIGLIEPAMIVSLGLGVGVLVSAVLLPMYSLSSAIS
ncbi:MAG: Type secretion system domain, type pilus assembly protein PilC [Candidatus Nomurabacteria bacterium]|nr:Type secretion system domain, type pilus assembly protein PilC [Candidatus Nomurabacteria bacterium]